jgi:lipopolysaccharide/colanic/teichoic acid biosynthesis glycosyltransferase
MDMKELVRGAAFKCLKFRSMVINSKEVLEDLLSKDIEAKKNGMQLLS